MNGLTDAEKMHKDGYSLWQNTRLGSQGQWSGIKGESRYSLPHDAEYMRHEPNGVNHSNGHPFFYKANTSRMTMDKPSGISKIDINNAYHRLGKIIKSGGDYVREIFSKENITLHHTPDGKALISANKHVHGMTPHNGGSYYNRINGVKP